MMLVKLLDAQVDTNVKMENASALFLTLLAQISNAHLDTFVRMITVFCKMPVLVLLALVDIAAKMETVFVKLLEVQDQVIRDQQKQQDQQVQQVH